MTQLILTSYTFFSFPSWLRQHCCFKNARLFWDCQLKIRLTRRFWCCFWASVGSWTLWVWVAHRRFLKPAALSCSAAAPPPPPRPQWPPQRPPKREDDDEARVLVGARRILILRILILRLLRQNFDPQIIGTEFWSSDYWDLQKC